MFKNYLKIAWRGLTTSKTFSFINITGLALGLSTCMLIMLYAQHEWSYDQFHANANRIYLTQGKLKLGSDSLYMPYLSYSTGSAIKEGTPAIEAVLRLKQPDQNIVIQNIESPELKFTENSFLFADSNFFQFFSFPLLSGSGRQALTSPFAVVVSERAAVKYFGKENPIGKTLRYNNAYDFVVTGISKEAPSNSSITFDFIAPVSSLLKMTGYTQLMQKDENIFSTYFLLHSSASASQLETALEQFGKTKGQTANDIRYIAAPLKNIHIYADTDKSNKKYLKLFPLVAGFILLLAIFNYSSLTTANSTSRLKEIGVRKVLGANKNTLSFQLFLESALYTTIAFVLGYALCLVLQPFFFRFLQLDMDSSFLYDPAVLITFVLLYIITVLLSAFYPSVWFSAFNPVTVLSRRSSRQGQGFTVRKFVTVFQFTVSFVLITCALIIQRQLYFIRHADTGIQKENVVMIPFSPGVGKNYTAFKNDLQSLPAVQEVSVALHPLFKGFDMMGVKPKNSDQMIFMPTLMVDRHFISLLKLKWKEQPNDSFFRSNKKDVALLNETAVERLNLHSRAINENVDNQFQVAGVLKDFNYTSLQNKIEPLCVFIVPDADTAALWTHQGGCMYAKIMGQMSLESIRDKLKAIYEKYDQVKPFEITFMDEAASAQYKAEDRLSNILNVFTAFALLIASLGLFGLATFMAVQRTKEIGVRKVLGATVQSIVLLLSKDFLKLVLLAILIASPVAWWAANAWLQNFAFRISIQWWMFAVGSIFVIAIALLTILYHSISTALAKPTKSLQTE